MAQGSLNSPEDWLAMHGSALYRYALVRTRDEHKAEDLVQETLLAALQARERFVGGSTTRTWLIGILKHKLMDLFRREAREAPLEDEDVMDGADDELEAVFKASGRWQERPADWGDPEDMLSNRQFIEHLQRCIDALPPRLARIFWLREVMEEETKFICKDLAITPTNLWTMLYRARMGLRRCLDRNRVGRT